MLQILDILCSNQRKRISRIKHFDLTVSAHLIVHLRNFSIEHDIFYDIIADDFCFLYLYVGQEISNINTDQI